MSPLDDPRGTTLLSLARAALVEALGGAAACASREPWLCEPGACFVTLSQQGALRGCIGSIEARRPLGEDVRANARGAAFHDPRFPRLLEVELPDTRIEVTLLSKLEPLEVQTEAEAIAALRPGVDGLVLSWGGRRGVFIPQMWQKLPEPALFLRYLRRKAELPLDGWPSGTRLQRFTARSWEEGEG
ncbi:MAG: AmmeMemoRadiSam system protein A [Myxococcaceae bacterium]